MNGQYGWVTNLTVVLGILLAVWAVYNLIKMARHIDWIWQKDSQGFGGFLYERDKTGAWQLTASNAVVAERVTTPNFWGPAVERTVGLLRPDKAPVLRSGSFTAFAGIKDFTRPSSKHYANHVAVLHSKGAFLFTEEELHATV